ncbi:MAG: tRNA (adenine(22)-N(1))-methyltransferase TrmK [Chitinophagaceae bacterium]|nr:tRNA (adenine(22)-N(1))-methyltransferase TrmK [Chitinophagaceae bacterium]
MKVCTDACLFGAIAAYEILQQKSADITCLDIGTGTGLLSLMVAQKNKIAIDAVEVEDGACMQARQNIEGSKFKENISVHHADILQFEPQKKYDAIISNPPFFENDLVSTDTHKNTARHNITLSLKDLLVTINRLLKNDGFFMVLLPCHRLKYFEEEALQYDFYLDQKILIKPSEIHDYFRGILFFLNKRNIASPKIFV